MRIAHRLILVASASAPIACGSSQTGTEPAMGTGDRDGGSLGSGTGPGSSPPAADDEGALAGDGAPSEDANEAADAAAGAIADSGAGSTLDSPTDASIAAAVCGFASGLNVPWVNFANDVPSPDIATFTTIFQRTHAAGGRVVRWWFHTNGTVTPGYDTSTGKALALQQSHVDGIKAILAAADAAGVAIDLSLWSFDMLQGGEGITSTLRTNNQNLLTVDEDRLAYIDNYLTPLVTALKGTRGLYSYEIFNEPEGMTQYGWTASNGGSQVDESDIQRSVNWFAAAIHTADPSALVTNGSQVFQYCSNASGDKNYYSDAALRSAGGKANGTLDFYEVHYYESNTVNNSCFTHPASYWGLDKKLVMGEFYAESTDGVAQGDLYTSLYSNGYNGAWAWSYESDQKWPSMQVPMQNLFDAHADVGDCP